MRKRTVDSLGGVENLVEVEDAFFVHPAVEVSGELYFATVYGRATLVMVKDRKLGNGDGSDWQYGGQTKECAYYLSEDLEWFSLGDLE